MKLCTSATAASMIISQLKQLTLTEEFAKINELIGKIRLPGDLVARAADKSI
jgi:hypothetical protein